jgi:rhomboid protease GluP
MSPERCFTCGKEFDLRFHTSPGSFECPDCAQQRALAVRSAQVQQPRATVSATSFPVTISFIAANALVFTVMVLNGVSALDPTPAQAVAFGADFGPLTLNGQWWRLVSSMFVHFGFIHIGLNMWCLWNLGRAAERLLGRFSYLFAYFASGIFGSIASVYWHPLTVGAGASGAIFGLAGVLVSFVYLKKAPSHLQLDSRMLGSLGTFILYNLIYGAAIPGISNAAHLGGLLMGLAFGALLPAASSSDSSRRARLSFAVVLTSVILVACAIETKRLRSGVLQPASSLRPLHELLQSHASATAKLVLRADRSLL